MKITAVIVGVATITFATAAPCGIALAPPGYYYPPGHFLPIPIDICKRSVITLNIVRDINNLGYFNKHVNSALDFVTPSWEPANQFDVHPNLISCHGTVVFDDGSAQAGTVEFSDAGSNTPLRTVWHPDCGGLPYFRCQKRESQTETTATQARESDEIPAFDPRAKAFDDTIENVLLEQEGCIRNLVQRDIYAGVRSRATIEKDATDCKIPVKQTVFLFGSKSSSYRNMSSAKIDSWFVATTNKYIDQLTGLQ